jgi:hypothetical protein
MAMIMYKASLGFFRLVRMCGLMLLGAGLLSLSLCAQEPSTRTLPDAPSAVKKQVKPYNPYLEPFRDPAFYIGTLEFTASVIADVHSTKVCEHTRPPQCAEAYPGHDTYGYVAPLIALEAAAGYGCSLMFHDHHKWRWVCVAIPALMSKQHWQDTFVIYPNGGVAKP